jgi:lipopolysaccharide/colanic/teichoic acid biosynthesis glycosyltransferase/RimJ/RimL family protein N-acetyltransferase
MYRTTIKPFLDFLAALIGLILLSPIFVVVTLLLAIANNRKPFFFQTRPGKNERLFRIIKFKTMTDKKDKDGNLLPDADRLTILGSFVRKTSLDEIPQLLNVIKGDMSLVGPRPLLPEYLSLYTPEQARRHNVKTGITGLAQVKGRNLMKFSERLKNDVYYIDNINFFLDIKILCLTVKTVLFKSSSVVIGQTVDEIDDIGLSRNLSKNNQMNIKGKKVILRAIELEDLQELHRWSNDPEINYMLGGWHFPSSKQDQLKWFNNLNPNSNNQRFAIVTEELGLIGMANLVDINWKDKNAFTGMLLGDKNMRGKGYGVDSIMTMNKYAFEELGLQRLDGSMISYNEASIAVYTKKCGWKVEGIKINSYFRKNKWWDKVIVGITSEQYFNNEINKNYWD